MADRVGAPIEIIEKRRPEPGVAKVMNIIGDVKGRNCFIVDDIVDTAGSLCEGAKALENAGAIGVYAAVCHPVPVSYTHLDVYKRQVLSELEAEYKVANEEGFDKVLEDWRKLSVTLGQDVRVI